MAATNGFSNVTAHPFEIGDTVELNRVTVEILQITDDGRPTKVAFHFDTPLEDDSIARFAGLEPFEPPPVGQTTAVR